MKVVTGRAALLTHRTRLPSLLHQKDICLSSVSTSVAEDHPKVCKQRFCILNQMCLKEEPRQVWACVCGSGGQPASPLLLCSEPSGRLTIMLHLHHPHHTDGHLSQLSPTSAGDSLMQP